MSTVEERFAKNEAAFRAVNERIEELGGHFIRQSVEETVRFVCECARPGCMTPLELTLSQYEQVRSEPRWFIVAVGHENSEVERVIARHPSHLVVEKIGEAG